MKKIILNWLTTSLYMLILMILAIFLFWEGCAKLYIEQYIDDNYGDAIKETYNNTELIKNFKFPVKNDKGES